MILWLELVGAYLGGAASTVVAIGLGGRWYIRRKLGLMLDLFQNLEP